MTGPASDGPTGSGFLDSLPGRQSLQDWTESYWDYLRIFRRHAHDTDRQVVFKLRREMILIAQEAKRREWFRLHRQVCRFLGSPASNLGMSGKQGRARA